VKGKSDNPLPCLLSKDKDLDYTGSPDSRLFPP
jgi:hypothetical protein